jgi:rod shape-determining protein MreC
LFLILETFTIILAVNSNKKKKALVINSANVVSGLIYEQINSYKDYFNLKSENERLLRDNIELKNKLNSSYKFDTAIYKFIHDTICIQQYSYLEAKVIKNSIFLQNNYLTIDKGTEQGIEEDMAVINPDGVIGIIIKTSTNYSVAISLLNSKIGISAKIKKNGYYGSIIWNGENYTHAILKDIPNHVTLEAGDTIITSGYSAIFPEGVLIGFVVDYEKNSEDNFYTITVKLSVDFKNITNVYLINNLLREEQLKLEEEAILMLE